MSEREFSVHQEEDEISSTHLGRVAVGSVVVGAAGVLVAGLLLVASTGSVRPGEADHGPAKRGAGGRDGLDLRAAQTRELERWGWSDRDAGIATIPIDRAIDVILGEVGR